MEEYRLKGENVPLSKYVAIKAGVCREHALIYHMALKEAGVENSFIYAKVFMNSRSEEHALNVVNIDGELRSFDSYNRFFNDQSLSDLLTDGGTSILGRQVGITQIYDHQLMDGRLVRVNRMGGQLPFVLNHKRECVIKSLSELL